MWLYSLFVGICIVKRVYPADAATITPAGTTLLSRNDVPSTSSDNTVDDDSDAYLPSLDWSDTFDWQLLKAVSSQQHKNILISPLSLKLALVMLYEGSAGSTEKQFQSVLQFPAQKSEVREKYKALLEALQDKRKDYILNIGTRLFLDSSIVANQQFAATVKNAYDADVESTNYTYPAEASRTINSWVDILTNGRIRDLVSADELREDVLLVVANAIYFKGRWRHQFPKNRTHTSGFYVSPTEVVSVQYMANTDQYYYGESKELDCKILRLPYKGKHFSMFFILPNSKGGLEELLKNINLQTLKRQLYLMDERTVEVSIPKFKFDFTSSFSKILQEFGLNTIFSNTASLPGIARGIGSGTKWLFVNDIKQKAGIEINEEGSTLYAATEIQLGNKFGEADYSFNATHPFLMFLEDQTTGAILFAGKVENPLDPETTPLVSRFGEENPVVPPVTTAPASQVTHGQQQRPNFTPLQLNPAPPPPDNTISSRFNYFDLELLQGFDDSQNYFISPASIKATLGMVLEGARGKCAEEISRVLRIPLDPSRTRDKLQGLLYDLNAKSGSVILEAANGAFVSNIFEIVPEFEKNLKQFYKADVRSVDFSNNEMASHLINGWVRNTTRGLIPEIITPANFNSDATLVIANALYFKGLWKNEFEEKSTAIKCFHTRRNPCLETKMMQTVDNFNYKFIDDLDAQAIELPYGDGKYAMLVLLPSEKHSVDGLIRDLQHVTFASIVNKLEPTEVLVDLPRFEIDYTADIVPNLQTLGIGEIFGSNANLSGIIAQGQIKINNIVHKAKVEVNEKGTIAAAATGVIVIPLMGSSMPRFVANHPFLFFIYHVDTKNIIFEGRLNEPSAAYDEIFAKPQNPQVVRPVVSSFAPPSQPTRPQTFTQPQNRQSPVPLTTSTQTQRVSNQAHPLFFPTDTKTGTGTVTGRNSYNQFDRNYDNNYQQRYIEE